jgi:hypothetical protein
VECTVKTLASWSMWFYVLWTVYLTRANHDETIALLAPRIWTGRRITLPLWTPMRPILTSVEQEN